MENVIVIAVILILIGFAGFYIYKSKKSGKKCIGCPDGGSCAKKSCCCCEDGHKNAEK